MENRFVRTSTLATFVPVTNHPDQCSPRRTSSEEKRTPRIRGAASFGSTLGVGSAESAPTIPLAGTRGARDPHATDSSANEHAPMRSSTPTVVRPCRDATCYFGRRLRAQGVKAGHNAERGPAKPRARLRGRHLRHLD